MKPSIFRGPIWTGFLRWMRTIWGIGFIVYIFGAIGYEIVQEWPRRGWIICAVLAVGAILLSRWWFRTVRRAAEEGEFD